MINIECASDSSSPRNGRRRKRKAANLWGAKFKAPTMPKRREVLNGKKVRREKKGEQGLQNEKKEERTKKMPGIKGDSARQGGFGQQNLN